MKNEKELIKMNVKKLLTEQNKLDKMILKNAGIASFHDVREKIGFALLVELGELANEVQTFKYWKKNQNIDRKKILEEYSDGIHFLNTYVFNFEAGEEFNPIIFSKDINKQFLEVYKNILIMIEKPDKEIIKLTYELYLGLASLLGISDREIETEYFKKNLVNQNRVKQNY
ncbi:hypothetical protein CJJ23_02025 [Mycoplasmopsis agassizii]|uniref:dUTPase n=2 Tax=Mycoplasmopsis agassizii TaxID=33922 RepID=A0A269TJ43_9BACT|nr:hypothetical protein CJJ23_02025 [Mycoplasmopsis agassizii]